MGATSSSSASGAHEDCVIAEPAASGVTAAVCAFDPSFLQPPASNAPASNRIQYLFPIKPPPGRPVASKACSRDAAKSRKRWYQERLNKRRVSLPRELYLFGDQKAS